MRPSRHALGLLDFSKRSTFLPPPLTSRLHRVSFSTRYSLSPPGRPVSQLGKLDPAWARVGRISQSAQHCHSHSRPAAAAAADVAASLRPLTNDTSSSSAHRSAAELAKRPNSSRYQIARQGPAVCVRAPQDFDFSSRNPLHSSTSYTLYLLPLVAGALLVYNVAFGTSPDTSPIEKTYQQSCARIPDEDMAALPGRPGNLTLEEEEKLRKFWEMFLQICGVFDEEGVDGDAPTPLADQRPATASSDKPKKKRLNPFKKRKDKGKENKGADKDAAETPAKENDPEDKWGESKAYHETLAKHTPEEIRATIWSMVKHDNPDALLLRFLRARKWDLQRALVMMVSTMNWRASEMQVDSDIMVNGEEHASIEENSSDESIKKQGEDFLAQMRLGKSYCYGIDKAGRPICVCRARLHRAGEQSETSLERYTVYLIETTRFLLSPPVDTGCIVFDLTGFSLANMDYTPVKFMIRCFEANYPEVWESYLCTKLLGYSKDLEEFIAKDKIPDEMDGTSGWTYEYIEPIPGENDKMKDTETRDKLVKEREALYEEFENKTIEWIHEDDATKRTAIKSERGAIAQKLKEQYWRLDPYIRSRTLYDRIGVIKPDGKLDYYPAWKAVATTNGTAAAAAVETSSDDLD
ncbi:hypothetical protein EKO27_g11909 [Xylaria grammica]|uniref:CRAL-TRIO domain-containing protein n=1 Tax=Xylaria grammica TaxID=363999 RepID=A0A439CM15_9PEZI|nr:hypothetical protein EKO27_g11909 [Xylaria grammica]